MRMLGGIALSLAIPMAAQWPSDAELRLKVGSVHLQNDIRLHDWLATTDLRTLSLDYVSPGVRGEVVRLSWTAGVSGGVSGDRDLLSPPYRSLDKSAYLQNQVRFTFQPRAQAGLEAAFGRTLTGGFRTEVRYGQFGSFSNQKGDTSNIGLFQAVFASWQQKAWRTSLYCGYFLVPAESGASGREIGLTLGRIF